MGTEVVVVLGAWGGMLSDGVAREGEVRVVAGWRIGGTVVTESCLTRQAVSRPRHGQQWALSGPGSGSPNNKGDGVVTRVVVVAHARGGRMLDGADSAVGGWWTRRGIATGCVGG